jgi:hypothetical protein
MSISDYLIDILIYCVNTIVSILPSQYSGYSANDFSNSFYQGISSLTSGYNFINNILPIDLLFTFLLIVISAEIILSFGLNGIKYLIKLVRG